MKRNDRLLTIGGAENQCHLIRIAKNLGYYVICVDLDKDCQGKREADEFYNISTNDVDAIVKLGMEKNVSGIICTQSDLGIKSTACVARKLGLKGVSNNTINLFTNKLAMREFLKTHNYNYPYFKKCTCLEDIREAIKDINGSAVIKPLDSQGSRGVKIINDLQEDTFHETLKYSTGEAAVIVEEYLGNEEYTVEGYMRNGRHTTLAISKKQHYKELPCVSNELLYSWTNEQELNELAEMHNNMIEKTGLEFGITHSEYIKKNNKFYLVEFTARGGGAHISSLIVPYISGIDVEKELLLDTLELSRSKYIVPQKRKVAVLKFLEFDEGKIREIKGIEEAKNIPEVMYIKSYYGKGDHVKKVLDDTNRHGFYIAGADSLEELRVLMRDVEDRIKIVYE